MLEVFARELRRGDLPLQRRQDRLGLLVLLAGRVGLSQQQGRLLAAARLDGRAGEVDGELGIARQPRRAGTVDQQRERNRGLRVEQPAGNAQRVVGQQRVALLHGGGQTQAHLAARAAAAARDGCTSP